MAKSPYTSALVFFIATSPSQDQIVYWIASNSLKTIIIAQVRLKFSAIQCNTGYVILAITFVDFFFAFGILGKKKYFRFVYKVLLDE